MHNVLIIFYIAFSIGNLFILPELGLFYRFYFIKFAIISMKKRWKNKIEKTNRITRQIQ